MIGVQGPFTKGKNQIYRVVTPHGSKQFSINKAGGKRQAKKLAQDYANEYNDAADKQTSHLLNMGADYTVADIIRIFEDYFEQLENLGKRADTSLGTYKNLFNRIKSTKYIDLPYQHIAEQYLDLEECLYINGWGHDAVSKTMKALKYAYRIATPKGITSPMASYIFDNGASNTDTDEDINEVIIPTQLELESILKVANPKWQLFYKLAATTGMRVSELRGLAFDNIDFANNFILVRQQATQNFKLTTKLKTKKSNRDIPLHLGLKKLLLELRNTLNIVPNIGHNSQTKGVKTNLVFPTSVGTAHSRQHIWNVFEKHKQAASVNLKGSMHCFRHMYASNLIDFHKHGKMSVLEISNALGHRSFTFTEEVYGHLIYPRSERQQLVNDISNAQNFAFAN